MFCYFYKKSNCCLLSVLSKTLKLWVVVFLSKIVICLLPVRLRISNMHAHTHTHTHTRVRTHTCTHAHTCDGCIQLLSNVGVSIINDQVQLLGSDPMKTADEVLNGQVLLLICRGDRAEQATVQPRQHITLRVVENLVLDFLAQAWRKVGAVLITVQYIYSGTPVTQSSK